MKRIMIAAFVALATFAATTAVLRSHAPGAHPPVSLSLQELSAGARQERHRFAWLNGLDRGHGTTTAGLEIACWPLTTTTARYVPFGTAPTTPGTVSGC